jgi:hypothetical protein
VEHSEHKDYPPIAYTVRMLLTFEIVLTFGFGEPNEECICVIDEADDEANQNNKDVADYNQGSDW